MWTTRCYQTRRYLFGRVESRRAGGKGGGGGINRYSHRTAVTRSTHPSHQYAESTSRLSRWWSSARPGDPVPSHSVPPSLPSSFLFPLWWWRIQIFSEAQQSAKVTVFYLCKFGHCFFWQSKQESTSWWVFIWFSAIDFITKPCIIWCAPSTNKISFNTARLCKSCPGWVVWLSLSHDPPPTCQFVFRRQPQAHMVRLVSDQGPGETKGSGGRRDKEMGFKFVCWRAPEGKY